MLNARLVPNSILLAFLMQSVTGCLRPTPNASTNAVKPAAEQKSADSKRKYFQILGMTVQFDEAADADPGRNDVVIASSDAKADTKAGVVGVEPNGVFDVSVGTQSEASPTKAIFVMSALRDANEKDTARKLSAGGASVKIEAKKYLFTDRLMSHIFIDRTVTEKEFQPTLSRLAQSSHFTVADLLNEGKPDFDAFDKAFRALGEDATLLTGLPSGFMLKVPETAQKDAGKAGLFVQQTIKEFNAGDFLTAKEVRPGVVIALVKKANIKALETWLSKNPSEGMPIVLLLPSDQPAAADAGSGAAEDYLQSLLDHSGFRHVLDNSRDEMAKLTSSQPGANGPFHYVIRTNQVNASTLSGPKTAANQKFSLRGSESPSSSCPPESQGCSSSGPRGGACGGSAFISWMEGAGSSSAGERFSREARGLFADGISGFITNALALLKNTVTRFRGSEGSQGTGGSGGQMEYFVDCANFLLGVRSKCSPKFSENIDSSCQEGLVVDPIYKLWLANGMENLAGGENIFPVALDAEPINGRKFTISEVTQLTEIAELSCKTLFGVTALEDGTSGQEPTEDKVAEFTTQLTDLLTKDQIKTNMDDPRGPAFPKISGKFRQWIALSINVGDIPMLMKTATAGRIASGDRFTMWSNPSKAPMVNLFEPQSAEGIPISYPDPLDGQYQPQPLLLAELADVRTLNVDRFWGKKICLGSDDPDNDELVEAGYENNMPTVGYEAPSGQTCSVGSVTAKASFDIPLHTDNSMLQGSDGGWKAAVRRQCYEKREHPLMPLNTELRRFAKTKISKNLPTASSSSSGGASESASPEPSFSPDTCDDGKSFVCVANNRGFKNPWKFSADTSTTSPEANLQMSASCDVPLCVAQLSGYRPTSGEVTDLRYSFGPSPTDDKNWVRNGQVFDWPEGREFDLKNSCESSGELAESDWKVNFAKDNSSGYLVDDNNAPFVPAIHGDGSDPAGKVMLALKRKNEIGACYRVDFCDLGAGVDLTEDEMRLYTASHYEVIGDGWPYHRDTAPYIRFTREDGGYEVICEKNESCDPRLLKCGEEINSEQKLEISNRRVIKTFTSTNGGPQPSASGEQNFCPRSDFVLKCDLPCGVPLSTYVEEDDAPEPTGSGSPSDSPSPSSSATSGEMGTTCPYPDTTECKTLCNDPLATPGCYQKDCSDTSACKILGSESGCNVVCGSESPNPSDSFDPSASPTVSPTPTVSPSSSPTTSPSGSGSPSDSPTASPSGSGSPTASPSGSGSPDGSGSGSPSPSPTITVSPSHSPTWSPSYSPSYSPPASPSPSYSPYPSGSPGFGSACEQTCSRFSAPEVGTGTGTDGGCCYCCPGLNEGNGENCNISQSQHCLERQMACLMEIYERSVPLVPACQASPSGSPPPMD